VCPVSIFVESPGHQGYKHHHHHHQKILRQHGYQAYNNIIIGAKISLTQRERERERGEKGELGLTTKRSYERACEGRWRIV
jgi:hypothetical protein